MSEVEFVSLPSQSLLCPVCHDVCHEPLITNVCHHSFCTQCIFQAMEQGDSVCPLCRQHLSERDLHPNLALSSLIQELLVFCRYRSLGCEAHIRLDSKQSHEKNCSFAPARCPNFVHGCDFESSESLVAKHLRDCIFQKLRGYIERNERQVQAMKETIQALSKEVEELRDQVRTGTVREAGASVPPSPVPSARISSWPAGELECKMTLNENSGVTALALSGELLYCGGHDGHTKVWDLKTQQLKSSNAGHKSSVWSLALDEPRSRLYSSSSDGTIRVWGTDNGSIECLQTLSLHRGRVYSLLLHGGRLFSASSDKTIRVWDLDTFECVHTFEGHTSGINSLSVQQDGAIVTGGNDQTIRIWDVGQGVCRRTIASPPCEVLSVAVGDGTLFGACYDASIVAYDIKNDYAIRGTLTGHKWEVWQLAYSNGALFSGSFDHTVKRWDLRTMTNTATLRGHKGYLHSVITSGESLITGCAARMVKVWQC